MAYLGPSDMMNRSGSAVRTRYHGSPQSSNAIVTGDDSREAHRSCPVQQEGSRKRDGHHGGLERSLMQAHALQTKRHPFVLLDGFLHRDCLIGVLASPHKHKIAEGTGCLFPGLPGPTEKHRDTLRRTIRGGRRS